MFFRVVCFIAIALICVALVHVSCPAGPTREQREVPEAVEASLPRMADVSKAQRQAAAQTGQPVSIQNELGMRFVLIPSGTFVMGTAEEVLMGSPDEVPHEVTIRAAFYCQTAEVTNAQYRRYKSAHSSMRYEGESLNGPQQPVVLVCWPEAVGFARWLTQKDELMSYRLPTEAEWEYVCRAGVAGAYPFPEGEKALYRFANFADRRDPVAGDLQDQDDRYCVAAPVGSYLANPWGVYDMLGNTSEWCADWYGPYPEEPVFDPQGPGMSAAAAVLIETTPSHGADERVPRRGPARVVRGGSWFTSPGGVKPARRYWANPGHRRLDLGFRLVAERKQTANPPR